MTHIGYKVAYTTKDGTHVEVIYRDRAMAQAYYDTLDMTVERRTLQAGHWDADMQRFTCHQVLAIQNWAIKESSDETLRTGTI